VYLFYVYEKHKENNSSDAFGQILVPPQVAGIANYDETGNGVGGSFAMGPFKFGLGYHEFKKTSRTKQKAWMGNIVWTAGNNQIIYQYMNAKDGGLSSSTAVSPDCDSNSIGYKYNFSRRTSFITHYVQVKNNDTATCNFGSNTLGIAAGQDPKGFALGLLHNF